MTIFEPDIRGHVIQLGHMHGCVYMCEDAQKYTCGFDSCHDFGNTPVSKIFKSDEMGVKRIGGSTSQVHLEQP